MARFSRAADPSRQGPARTACTDDHKVTRGLRELAPLPGGRWFGSLCYDTPRFADQVYQFPGEAIHLQDQCCGEFDAAGRLVEHCGGSR